MGLILSFSGEISDSNVEMEKVEELGSASQPLITSVEESLSSSLPTIFSGRVFIGVL